MGRFQMQQLRIVDGLGHSQDRIERRNSMSGRSVESIRSPERTAVVLAVSPVPSDRIRLREILSQEEWKLQEASGCCEALALMCDQSVPVLLCERDLADGDWEELLNAAARLPAPPNLIVFSRLADASLWAQVLNLGGFDVLMTPFEPEEVLRVTSAAWSRWECDFVAKTAGEAETADPASGSPGKRCHAARPDGRDFNVSGLVARKHAT